MPNLGSLKINIYILCVVFVVVVVLCCLFDSRKKHKLSALVLMSLRDYR